VPDIDNIAREVRASFEALLSAANRLVRPVPWWHAEVPA
jgi:hypothetical protein